MTFVDYLADVWWHGCRPMAPVFPVLPGKQQEVDDPQPQATIIEPPREYMGWRVTRLRRLNRTTFEVMVELVGDQDDDDWDGQVALNELRVRRPATIEAESVDPRRVIAALPPASE